MNEKLEALNQEIEKTEKKLRRAQHEEKILEHQIKALTRKERTHRLCTRAAMLESYLPHPEAITDEQVSLVQLDLPELKELVSLMRYSSNNLNQLTRKVHETGRVYDADLEDIFQRQEQLWEGVKEILTQLSKLS